MKTFLCFLAWLYFAGCTGSVSAQPVTPPPDDIRLILREMSTAQKMEALDYLRSAGADLDWEIQQAYTQLSPEKRSRAVMYMKLLDKGLENIPRTTVSWNRDTLRY